MKEGHWVTLGVVAFSCLMTIFTVAIIVFAVSETTGVCR